MAAEDREMTEASLGTGLEDGNDWTGKALGSWKVHERNLWAVTVTYGTMQGALQRWDCAGLG